MPNRIIRDAVLDSPRYHALSSDTVRLLFFELLLLADDYGLTPAYPLFLSRRTSAARRATDEAIAKMTGELSDHDLIRLYPVGLQVYAFIPRFGNWPRAQKPKWPMPPAALGGNEIKDLQEKRSAKASRIQCGGSADAHETETETETETAKKKRRLSASADQPAKPASCPHDKIVQSYHDVLPDLPRVKLVDIKGRKAQIAEFWRWVLTSTKSDGSKRATNADEAIAWIRSYFERALSNDFLMGRTRRDEAHRNWRCNFDYLLTDKGKKQVIEHTEVPA